MDCGEFDKMSLLYVAGLVEADEKKDAESHLAGGCSRCRQTLEQARVEAGQMWITLEPIEPPASVKRRLMARVRHARHAQTRHMRGRAVLARLGWTARPRTWMAAAALLCVVVAVVASQQWERANQLASQLSQIRAGRGHSFTQAHAGQLWPLLGSSSLTIVPLRGIGQTGKTWGRLFWDRKRQVCFLFSPRLHPTPKGTFYHLWFLTADGQVVMARSFRVVGSGHEEIVLSLPDHGQQLAKIVRASITFGRGRDDHRPGIALLSGPVPTP